MSFESVMECVEQGVIDVDELFKDLRKKGNHGFCLEIFPVMLKKRRSNSKNVSRLCHMVALEVMNHQTWRENIAACGSGDDYLEFLTDTLVCGAIPLVQVFYVNKLASQIPVDILSQSFSRLKSIFLRQYIEGDCFIDDAKGLVIYLAANLSLKVMENWPVEELEKEQEYFQLLQNCSQSGRRLKKITHRLEKKT